MFERPSRLKVSRTCPVKIRAFEGGLDTNGNNSVPSPIADFEMIKCPEDCSGPTLERVKLGRFAVPLVYMQVCHEVEPNVEMETQIFNPDERKAKAVSLVAELRKANIHFLKAFNASGGDINNPSVGDALMDAEAVGYMLSVHYRENEHNHPLQNP